MVLGGPLRRRANRTVPLASEYMRGYVDYPLTRAERRAPRTTALVDTI